MAFGPTEDPIDCMDASKPRGLLASSRMSTTCNVPMRQGCRNDVTDGIVWRCSQCKTTKSIRQGSFFQQVLAVIEGMGASPFFWMKQYPVTNAAKDIEVDKNKKCDVYGWCRDVCSTKLLQTPIVLSGAGVVVQADKSLFRHKPKVTKLYTTFCTK